MKASIENHIRAHQAYFTFFLAAIFILFLSACGGGGGGGGPPAGGDNSESGSWIGNWIQVNFLANDDNGVWDADDLSGIGFTAKITETEWVETDEFGNGCSVTFSYSVDSNNKHSKEATSKSDNCPASPLELFNDTGDLNSPATIIL